MLKSTKDGDVTLATIIQVQEKIVLCMKIHSSYTGTIIVVIYEIRQFTYVL